jgi:F-type H+-transporting ATPase subunit delta
MANETLARRYATAVFQLAVEAGAVKQVGHDLHTFVAALVLVQKRREALAPEIVAQFDVLEREARGAQTLRVTTARPLGQAELDAIVAKLGAAFKTPLEVTQTVDPELIGGVQLTVGDKRIDGTIAGRLDDLARMLSTN